MSRFLRTFVLFAFFIWIIPLGAFIEASKEEKVCNGERAVCLCTHLLVKALQKQRGQDAGKTMIKNVSPLQKQNAPTGQQSFTFVPFFAHNVFLRQSSVDTRFLLYTSSFFLSIEHVPKRHPAFFS